MNNLYYPNTNKQSHKPTTMEEYHHRGVKFFELMGFLEDPKKRKWLIEQALNIIHPLNFDAVAGLDSRGYPLASILADRLDKHLILVRKAGKLPDEAVIRKKYSTEYSTAEIEVKTTSVTQDMKVLIVDDLVATGGTIKATIELLNSLKATCAGILCILDLQMSTGLETYSILPLTNDTKVYPQIAANEYDPTAHKRIIFSGPSMEYFRDTLINQETRAGHISWDKFPDGWPNIRFDSNLQDKQVYWILTPYAHELAAELIVLKVLPRQGIKSLNIIIPYFAPGTMERVEQEGILASAEPVAKLLSEIEMTQTGPVIIDLYDIHALPERFYFGQNVIIKMHSAMDAFINSIRQQHITVCFPDEGAYKRFSTQFADFPTLTCSKIRDGDKRKIICPPITGPKNVVIVDDICHSGGTLIECAKALRDQGAERIEVFVTHMVGENGAYMRFFNNEFIDKFITTNSHPTSRLLNGNGKFHVMPLITTATQITTTTTTTTTIPHTKRVAVASASQVKLQAVQQAFSRLTDAKYEITGFKGISSNVPEQPFDTQIKEGAENRWKSLKIAQPNYDYYVSIESGIKNNMESTIILINDTHTIEITHGEIPPKYLEKLKENPSETLGKILSKEMGVKHDDWYFRFFGKSRRHAISDAIYANMTQ